MRSNQLWKIFLLFMFALLTSCASTSSDQSMRMSDNDTPNTNLPLYHGQAPYSLSYNEEKFAQRLPQNIDGNGKTILVDPKVFAWGAYDDGKLVRAGIATAGAEYCPDEGKPCKTHSGTYRIFKIGGEECVSRTYPIGKGGALMPYCMFFRNGESLHGSPDQMMAEANISHGCVHMRIPDAEWLSTNFASVGTKVVVLPY